MAHRNYVFSADDGVHGQELWITDGTAAGTHIVSDIAPGSTASSPSGFTALGNGQIIFSADDATNGRELWVTDGTTAGTHIVSNIYPGSTTNSNGTTSINGSNPSEFTAIGGGKAIFSANNAVNGQELWITDGSSKGTSLLNDIKPGSDPTFGVNSSSPHNITYIGAGKAMFSANNPDHYNQLYIADGTSAGTKAVGLNYEVNNITVIGNGLELFNSYYGAASNALFVSDGTKAGVLFSSYGTAITPSGLTQLGTGRALFTGTDAQFSSTSTHNGIWISDGTSAGTQLIATDTTSSGPHSASSFTALGRGTAVFAAQDSTHGNELWVTDGTAAGTHIVSDIWTFGYTPYNSSTFQPYSSNPSNMTAIGDGRAVFTATAYGSNGLYVTDGTSAGTNKIVSINAFNFKSLDDGRVAFQGSDATHGSELWVTDGTTAGTHIVADINSGSGASNANGFTSVYIPPVASESFNFKFTDVQTSFVNGIALLTGPDGIAHDVTGVQKLIFTDGTITEHAISATVDDLFYYASNKDVWAAHLDATAHYNASGWHEGRDPNADFSTNGYLAANQDVAKAGINPLSHYDANGWKEGRDPSANFDNELYLLNNPDVKAAGVDPLAHYLQSGQAEGRQAYAAIGKASDFTHASFDAEYYLLANADVAKAALASGGDTFAFAFQHYQASGWKEGRAADAYFDSAYYLAHNPDVAAAGVNPLAHYDQVGWKEGRDPSAAFHTNAYLAANPDVAAAHIDPLTHYLQYGADEGRHLA